MKIMCFLLIIFAVFVPRLHANGDVPEIITLSKDGFQVDRGSADGVKIGSTGKVYYLVNIGGKDRRNDIAKFVVTGVEENTCQARVTQKTKNPDIGNRILFEPKLTKPLTPPPSPPTPPDKEVVFWNSIKNSQDAADFRAYLQQYPRGVFVGLAVNRIRALEAGNEPEEDKYGWVEIGAFPFAEVTVDGKSLGEVPPLKKEKLAVGEHTIVFSLAGRPSVTKKITIEDNVTQRVFYKFK